MNFLYDKKLDHIPFSKIDLEKYLPELDRLILLSKERIESIKRIGKPTFDNTILELENVSYEMDLLAGVFF